MIIRGGRFDAGLIASPDLFPLDLDVAQDRVRFVRLSRTAYREESFLDERILPRLEGGAWVERADMERAASALDGEGDFIFHIGHVGSTLLSRLLGENDRIFSLREPASLRTLARLDGRAPSESEAWRNFDRLAGSLLRLYARVYHPAQRSLVKATSFVSEIGGGLLARSPSSKAILMFVSPQTYMATILAGPATRAELGSASPSRLARLEGSLGATGWRLEDLSPGELAAMGWACEISALAEVARQFPTRVSWLDFDGFLARPGAGLSAVLRHLHADAPDAAVRAMLASPYLGRYSKATEFPYDAAMRRQVLEEGARRHGMEIERGLAWLNAAGTAHPAIAEAARAAADARRQSDG